MRALLLQPSVAVGILDGSKYSCSPRETATKLQERDSDVEIGKISWYAPALTDKRILSAHNFWPNIGLTTRGESPSAWSKCFVENAAILDLRKVNQAI